MSRTMLEHELIGWLDNARKTYGDPPIAKPLVKRALGELMRLTDELTALRAENARLKGEVEQERQFIDLLTTEKQTAEMTLDDAAMCIRRLLHRLGKHEPDIDMIKQINEWLVRKNLQGSPLRATPPKETNRDA